MSDDLVRQMEIASLLADRYYLVLNNLDEDSFSMNAYDTTPESTDNPDEIPAGLIVLNGLIELLENDFDRVWDAGTARLSFVSMVNNIQIELDDDAVTEVTEKVIEREDNILKVQFGEKQ